MYAKTINLLSAGNKAFVKYQAQGGGGNLKPPLRTSLIIHHKPIKNDQAMLFYVKEASNSLFPFYFSCELRQYRSNAI